MKCNLCQREINTKKERYVHIEDWEKNKLIKDVWCHNQCFNKAMNKNLTELEKQAKVMLNRAEGIFNMMGIEQQKEFVI